MFDDYFKLRVVIGKLIGINEALRPYVPDAVANDLEALASTVSDVADNLKDK